MQDVKRADPAREFLGSYWELRNEHGRLERKIEELESQCQKVTAKYGAGIGGSGGRNSVWDALIEARERAGVKLTETLSREAEVERFIERIPEKRCRQLLRYRYLELLSWERIAKEMGYCTRQLRRLHGKALQAARKLWSKQQGGTSHENH